MIMNQKENEFHKTHFSNLIAFLSQKTQSPNTKIIKNALLLKLNEIKNVTQTTDSRKVINSMCSHCFTTWKDGEFSVRFKPKNRSKLKIRKSSSKRMIVKCSICSYAEYRRFDGEQCVFLPEQKNISVTHRNVTKSNKPFKRSTNNSKSIAKKPQKKKFERKESNKKTNLTLLHDLL